MATHSFGPGAHLTPLPGADSNRLIGTSVYPRLWLDRASCPWCHAEFQVGTMAQQRPLLRTRTEDGTSFYLEHVDAWQRVLATTLHRCDRPAYGPAKRYDWEAAWSRPDNGACGACPCCALWTETWENHECAY